MVFNVNLDGQEAYNSANNTGNLVTDSVGTNAHLAEIIDPTNAAPAYTGFPDFSTNKTIHDSLGGEHRITSDFFKRAVVDTPNSNVDFDGDGNNDKYTSWFVRYTVSDFDKDTGTYIQSGVDNTTTGQANGGNTGTLFELRFDDNGRLQRVYEPNSKDPALITGDSPVLGANGEPVFDDLAGWTDTGTLKPDMSWLINNPLTGAVDPINFTAEFNDMTEFSGSYNIRGVSQNGYEIGDLIGLATGSDGVIEARYSNGRAIPVAQLAVANFSDKNAMHKLGGQTYAESFNSGTAQLGSPDNNGMGSVVQGSLEYSNVDTTAELVEMIQVQRMYQASAQVLSTSQTLTQTILNL
jgi:flagellar hook protein FlgE